MQHLLTRFRRRCRRRWSATRVASRQPRTGFTAIPATTHRPDTAAGFDPARAWKLLTAQCRLGPRNPGGEGHRNARELLLAELSAVADEVVVQDWHQRVDRGVGAGSAYPMTNLVGRITGTGPGTGRPDVLLATHWDTRPVADEDPDPARRHDPAPGANDGGSGVAVLLELGRALHADRPERTVALALFDGEDLGEFCYGSRLFARTVRRAGGARWRPGCAVVVDMVGGADLRCATETGSVSGAPQVWRDLHAAADRLGLAGHFHGPALRLTDDHVHLARAGVPSVLLIDFAYPYRHTSADTVEHCDPASLAVVGRVLEVFVRHPR